MGIWILMLCLVLLIPGLMIGFGRWSLKGGPEEINWVIGYRTDMSMKNKDTWVFAHREIGRLWTKWGKILIIVSAAVLLMLIGRGEDAIGTAGSVILFAQLIVLIACIFPVEKKLRETFDKDGSRKHAGLSEQEGKQDT